MLLNVGFYGWDRWKNGTLPMMECSLVVVVSVDSAQTGDQLRAVGLR